MQPLDDVTVVDVSLTLPGPYATLQLAQLGATVVNVEPPYGDALRYREPEGPDGQGYLYEMLNEGKQTASIDLKDDRGRELLLDLVGEADVFVEGFRPGVVDDLGVGPDTLREVNPDLVYCSLSGFGQTGPRREQPAHALNYEGLAGLLDAEDPSLPGFPVTDFSGAQMLVTAILAAIRNRDRGGGGKYIDLGLYEVLATWNKWNSPWAGSDESPFDRDPLVGGEYPCYNTYETADGRHLTLGIMEPKFWEQLCERLDRPDLVDGQFDTGGTDGDIYQQLQATFEQRPLEEWVDRLSSDLPVAAVKSAQEALEDPQLVERGHAFAFDPDTSESVQSFEFPVSFEVDSDGTEAAIVDAAGYDEAALSDLREAGVLSDDDWET